MFEKRTSGVKEVNDRGMRMQYNNNGLKEVLYQQIEKLAEESNRDSADTETKIRIAGEICRITDTIIMIDAD